MLQEEFNLFLKLIEIHKLNKFYKLNLIGEFYKNH